MTKTAWIIILGACAAIFVALQIVGYIVAHDQHGSTPEETIHLFLAIVKQGNYAEAERFSKPDVLEKHKHFTWTERVDSNGVTQPSAEWLDMPQSAEAHFRDNYLVDSYTLEFEGSDKGYRWIYFAGMQNGRVRRTRYFMREIDGRCTRTANDYEEKAHHPPVPMPVKCLVFNHRQPPGMAHLNRRIWTTTCHR